MQKNCWDQNVNSVPAEKKNILEPSALHQWLHNFSDNNCKTTRARVANSVPYKKKFRASWQLSSYGVCKKKSNHIGFLNFFF